MNEELGLVGLKTMSRNELLAMYDKLDANRSFHAVLLARGVAGGQALDSPQMQMRLAHFADADRVIELVSDENSSRILTRDKDEEAA